MNRLAVLEHFPSFSTRIKPGCHLTCPLWLWNRRGAGLRATIETRTSGGTRSRMVLGPYRPLREYADHRMPKLVPNDWFLDVLCHTQFHYFGDLSWTEH